ncbi:MAG TPA: sulfite dehydrogenase [Gemmatimonadaceae bacterium]|nr:sulfite dehydrogenase [Gemmatimonadaceae bacterium]
MARPDEPLTDTSPTASDGVISASTGDESPVSRRAIVVGAALAAGSRVLRSVRGADREPEAPQAAPAIRDPVPDTIPDPTKIQGRAPNEVGQRSSFERPRRKAGATSSQTPLDDLHGEITPSDLHYERHHAGVAVVDPRTYTLLVHGLVDRPTIFTLDDLTRFPSTSRVCFLECSGNLARNARETSRAQDICGLTSQSEWTGVRLATLFRDVGVRPDASWFLAEGGDAAVLARSIPIEKAWDDAMIVYAQNGEAIRPEQGYPARLLLPGWEGNTNVKWLRRLELATRPFMTREETSKYTEALKGDKARQFSFLIDARSIITSPTYPQRVQPGWIEIRGIAWSGRGHIARTDVSFDEGHSWHETDLQDPVRPKAHTRFRYLWKWNGRETTVLSRATDETGYVQPTQRALIDARGLGSGPYHLNPITGWRIHRDGSVVFRTEPWA